MRKVILSTLLIIVVVGGALVVERSFRLNRPVARQATTKTKELPPSLRFRDFQTKDLITLDKFKGRVLLINFWASWCEACIAEMPSIQKLYDTLHSDGFDVIAVNVEDNPERAVPRIVSKLKLTFPVYLDVEEQLADVFNVSAIPFSALVDRSGRIVWSESGERDWSSESVLNEVRGVLKQ